MLLGIATILLLYASELSAQYAVPIKIDEFGNTNCDDYRARIDTSLAELRKSPDAKGHILVYEGDLKQWVRDRKTLTTTGWRYAPSEVGLAKDIIKYFKQHLAFRNFPTDRVLFVDAGFREKFAVEVWLVPDGAAPPGPTPTRTKLRQRKRVKRPFGFCGEM
jgi:hypothetical protein